MATMANGRVSPDFEFSPREDSGRSGHPSDQCLRSYNESWVDAHKANFVGFVTQCFKIFGV